MMEMDEKYNLNLNIAQKYFMQIRKYNIWVKGYIYKYLTKPAYSMNCDYNEGKKLLVHDQSKILIT